MLRTGLVINVWFTSLLISSVSLSFSFSLLCPVLVLLFSLLPLFVFCLLSHHPSSPRCYSLSFPFFLYFPFFLHFSLPCPVLRFVYCLFHPRYSPPFPLFLFTDFSFSSFSRGVVLFPSPPYLALPLSSYSPSLFSLPVILLFPLSPCQQLLSCSLLPPSSSGGSGAWLFRALLTLQKSSWSHGKVFRAW